MKFEVNNSITHAHSNPSAQNEGMAIHGILGHCDPVTPYGDMDAG